jgi:hypothetical protein
MAAGKKPVDRTPICAPSYLRRIDPICVHGRVLNGFWRDRSNRRDFLLWLGRQWMQRGLQQPEPMPGQVEERATPL